MEAALRRPITSAAVSPSCFLTASISLQPSGYIPPLPVVQAYCLIVTPNLLVAQKVSRYKHITAACQISHYFRWYVWRQCKAFAHLTGTALLCDPTRCVPREKPSHAGSGWMEEPLLQCRKQLSQTDFPLVPCIQDMRGQSRLLQIGVQQLPLAQPPGSCCPAGS